MGAMRPVESATCPCGNLNTVWRALQEPKWIARIVWMVGLVTVISALAPTFGERLRLIHHMVPPVFPVTATVGALISGILLILLGRSLKRGKRRAWAVATTLTALATVFHLVKGLDFEEALLTALVFALLLISRKNFAARSDPRSNRQLLLVAVIMPTIATFIGWLWLTTRHRGQLPGTTAWDRLQEVVLGLIGIVGPIQYTSQRHQDLVSLGLITLSLGLILLPILLVAS
jgi:lysyl-tRNA synthetase class 2